jgi:hypothetical protein
MMAKHSTKSIVQGVFLFVSGGVAAFLLAGAVRFVFYSQPDIEEVALDRTSFWGTFFLERAGFPVLRVRAFGRARYYVDYLSIVGTGRSREWFKELGFEALREVKVESRDFALSGTGVVSGNSGSRSERREE